MSRLSDQVQSILQEANGSVTGAILGAGREDSRIYAKFILEDINEGIRALGEVKELIEDQQAADLSKIARRVGAVTA